MIKIKPFKKCKCCGRDEGEEFLDIKNSMCLRCRIEKGLFKPKKLELLKKMLELEKEGNKNNSAVHCDLDTILLNYIDDIDIRYLWERICKCYCDIESLYKISERLEND